MPSRELLLEAVLESPEATERFGERLGARLRAGAGISLRGELGAGKTVLVRGLARGLRVDEPGEVRSPTYLLMVEHPGPLPLLHVDAYFAERGDEFLADGGEAYLREGGVVAIEWGERLRAPLPGEFLEIELRHASETARSVRVFGDPARWRSIVAGLDASASGKDA